jgi:hypothetical protein
LETLIEIGEMLEMSDPVKTKDIAGLIDRCKQMINGLIRRYEGDNELK